MNAQRFNNVWDALETKPGMAAQMRARAGLMLAISKTVAGWKLSQAEAARRLGMTQPRLNDLLRGKISKFSLDALMLIADAAGLKVTWRVTRRAA